MSAMRQICTIRDVSCYKSAVYTEAKATNSLMQPFVFIFYYILVTFFYYIRQRIVKEKICPDAMGKTYLKNKFNYIV